MMQWEISDGICRVSAQNHLHMPTMAAKNVVCCRFRFSRLVPTLTLHGG